MEMNHTIKNVADLKLRIRELKALKNHQEAVLKADVKDIMESLKPSNIIKNATLQFATDDDAVHSVMRTGISAVSSFIIDRIFSRKGIKGYLTSMLLKGVSNFFIQRYKGGLGDLAKLFGQNEEQPEESTT